MRLRYHQKLSINSPDFQLKSSLISQSQVIAAERASQARLRRAKLGSPVPVGAPTNMWAELGPGELAGELQGPLGSAWPWVSAELQPHE